MLHHHTQAFVFAADGIKNAVNEDGFPVEDIDICVCDFAVGA